MTFFVSLFIGGILLLAGLTKASHSRPFIEQLNEYYPTTWIWVVALGVISLECALGVALVFQSALPILMPVTLLVFIVFSSVTLWQWKKGSIEDCGCYGSLFKVTPQQSFLLNCSYVTLITTAYVLDPPTQMKPLWPLIISGVLAILLLPLSLRSIYEPWVDWSLIRLNRRWKKKWIPDLPHQVYQQSALVVFLGKDCPYCKQWIPVLNVFAAQSEAPYVVGVMHEDMDTIDDFLVMHDVRFPILAIGPLLFQTMTKQVPLAVHVKDGIIQNKWIGELPKHYFEYVNQFYESLPPIVFPTPPPTPDVFNG